MSVTPYRPLRELTVPHADPRRVVAESQASC
jgi:hypothetical protein